MPEQLMWVIFNKDTGAVTAISNEKNEEDNAIAVPLSEVKTILEGKDSRRNYVVQYNPKIKNLEFVPKHSYVFDAYSIKDFVYEMPEHTDSEADITLIQDVPNTCWKIQLGKHLRRNLREKGISLNTNLLFSVTKKGDPNILYKSLSVHFSQVVGDNYYIIPFSMPFETEDMPISVYTSKRFDTYYLKRIFDEQ